MRVILDTNVFVSGVFFGGVPGRILEAWRDGQIRLVVSAEILDEYQRVGQILAADHPGVDLEPLLGLLAVHAEVVEAPPLAEQVCVDPDDERRGAILDEWAAAQGEDIRLYRGAAEQDLRREVPTPSGGVADNFDLGLSIDSLQDLIDPAEYLVLDQVLWAIPALEDGKALENHNATLADLEG